MIRMFKSRILRQTAMLTSVFLAVGLAMAAHAEPATAESSAPETAENSWRYENGVPIYNEDEPVLLWEDFTAESAELYNSDGGAKSGQSSITHRGIDVSHHQGKIDWQAAKDSGVEFAIIRCGIGNEYDGVGENKQDDAYWEYNASECERLGIPYGVYLYSYATDTDTAANEARHTLNLLSGHHPRLPVFLDLEQLDSNDRPIASNEMYGAIAQTWCDKVSSAGYKVGIYSYTYFFNNYLTDSRFNNSSWYRWVADYNSSCTYNGRYEMWQNSSKGSVAGIDGYVDTDIWYGNFPFQVSVFRLYNPDSGEHFYTTNEEEMENLASLGWHYEGVAWTTSPDSGTPVYRLYNPYAGDHHYTTSWEETEHLQTVGWRYEGICWYSDGTVPVYRLYNPYAQTGTHHFTTSISERDHLASLGWRTEGIGWYGMS